MSSNFAPQPASNKHLTFKLLDDVMLLPSDRYKPLINNARVHRIGPLIEYAYHHYDEPDKYFRPICDLGRYFESRFQSIKLNQVARDVSVTAKAVEFFSPPTTIEDAEEDNWMRFCRRLEDAAMRAGLPKEFAYALAGTFGEMTSNLIEHSNEPGTGLVGYRWHRGEFEYTVADAGLGVLASLRSHPDFAWIADSGEALEQAASDGVSRFGLKSHRGTGFHSLVFNIANRNSYLRFRSGDHVYTIDGIHGFPQKQIRPCGQLPGLLISVVSHPFPSS